MNVAKNKHTELSFVHIVPTSNVNNAIAANEANTCKSESENDDGEDDEDRLIDSSSDEEAEFDGEDDKDGLIDSSSDEEAEFD